MPPQSSLPFRDGRVGPPLSSPPFTSSENQDAEYSDDDIRLLEEIVRLGESLYPTLPERDRLPTNALFQAAEQVLPQYGYDAENAPSHISRLIFKIGGQRSGETLSDKFHAVLAGMNINLEYIPSSPYQASPAGGQASSRLYVPSEDETGDFDFGPRRIPHRRHSSVSRTIESPLRSGRGDYDLPIRPQVRARSASLTELFASPGGAQLPDGNARAQQWKHGFGGLGPLRVTQEPGTRPTRPQVQYSTRNPRAGRSGADEGGDEPEHSEEVHVQRFQPRFSAAEKVIGFPRGLGSFRGLGDGAGRKENKGLQESPLIIPNAHLTRRAARSEASDGFRGTSDTTVQSVEDEDSLRPRYQPPAVDFDDLEARLQQFGMESVPYFIKETLFDWQLTTRLTRNDHRELESRAIEFDNHDLVTEALDIWQEVASSACEERLRSEVAREHEVYVERMENRANRVYQIFTIRTVLMHWQDSAREEADRTAVARRHLVRKRAFDGWRAQHVADESKVVNFVLINALQKWAQFTLHHQIRERVAVQRYEHTLAADSLHMMWQTHKGNLADDCRTFQLIYNTMSTWVTRTRQVLLENGVAVTLDERLVLDEVLTIWREETEDLQDVAHNTTVELLVRDCQRKLEYWREQTRLTRLLRQYISSNRENLLHRILETWYFASVEGRRETELADILNLDGSFQHWRNEAKVRSFRARVESQEKRTVLMHWAREERLAWYLRYSEANTRREILGHFLAAAQRSRETRIRGEQNGKYIYEYYAETDCVDVWFARTETMWRHRQNANLVRLYRTTRPLLEIWQENHHLKLVRDAYYGREADRHARRFTILNVLDRWPVIAEEVKRERMMTALRCFRREYKVNLAQSCIDKWLEATFDSLDLGDRAAALQIRHGCDEINDYLEHWRGTATTAQNMAQVAADGEVETFCTVWQERLYDLQEAQEYSVRFDANQVLRDCLKRWEFPALQMESQRQVVAAVQNRNEKRLCREILDTWLQRANPDSTRFDLLQFSTRSRRSVRLPQQPPVRSAGLFGAAEQQESPLITLASSSRPQRTRPQTQGPLETPRLPFSQLRFSRGGSTRGLGSSTRLGGLGVSTRFGASISNLGPMPEFDDEEADDLPGTESNDPAFMSTPTKWTGSVRPLSYQSMTNTPSTILPSPYERQLRREYGQPRPPVGFSDIQEESLEED